MALEGQFFKKSISAQRIILDLVTCGILINDLADGIDSALINSARYEEP